MKGLKITESETINGLLTISKRKVLIELPTDVANKDNIIALFSDIGERLQSNIDKTLVGEWDGKTSQINFIVEGSRDRQTDTIVYVDNYKVTEIL